MAQNDSSKTANITYTIFDRTYKRRRFENRWDQTFCILITKDVLSVIESANLRQRQNSKQKWSGIRIRIFGLTWIRMSVVSVPKLWMHYLVGVRHFAKYGTNRLLIARELRKQRNANKCPKIAYSLVVKKMKVIRNPRANPDHHQKSITSRGSSCPCLPSLVEVRFRVRQSSVILFTEWQNEWKNDRERSHNICLKRLAHVK